MSPTAISVSIASTTTRVNIRYMLATSIRVFESLQVPFCSRGLIKLLKTSFWSKMAILRGVKVIVQGKNWSLRYQLSELSLIVQAVFWQIRYQLSNLSLIIRAVFSPKSLSNIKSITDNSGCFSPKSLSTIKSRGGGGTPKKKTPFYLSTIKTTGSFFLVGIYFSKS